MTEKLTLVLVTLERQLLDVACDEVTLPGELGYLGILPGHAPMLATLKAGELAYRDGSKQGHVALSGGFCEVHDDVVRVLADRAQLPSEIDVEAARQRAAEAEEELHRALDESYREAMAKLAEAEAQLQVAERR